MKILFMTSVAIITPKPAESCRLSMDTSGLPLKHPEGDDYYFSDRIGVSPRSGQIAIISLVFMITPRLIRLRYKAFRQ
jgi:hypothetical protein